MADLGLDDSRGKSYGVSCVARAVGRADATALPGWVVERRLLLHAVLMLLVPVGEAMAAGFELADIEPVALVPW